MKSKKNSYETLLKYLEQQYSFRQKKLRANVVDTGWYENFVNNDLHKSTVEIENEFAAREIFSSNSLMEILKKF